ncbi:glycosyltransferase [Roseiconus lacunae]|uniref:glycosyltransferase n=1 Tax=Roseiconus lacunae TaxID=2605694 RepID=UPI0011F3AA5E|nr:glycosyltransferase [Roseiconus lacunae]
MHKMQVAGAEVLVEQIIDRLENTIDATVFCLDDVGEIGYRLRDKGVPVIVLGRRPGMDLSVAKKLADEVKRRDIQVLHAHQYTPFFYSAIARIRYGVKAKVIFTEHGRHYPDVVSWKRRLANRTLLQRYADITTACCDFSTKALQTIEGFPKAFTLNNGVDVSDLVPRGDESDQSRLRERLGLDQDRPYAACIARFHEVKDHATLVRAWAKVHQQLPEAHLLLVGDGEERENIENLIAELSTSSNSQLAASISLLGIRNDVPELLRAIDVFTLTSVSEAASLTLLEAMASECPSVVTDVGGNAEHLRHGVDGYLAPRGDDEALAGCLVKLLSDPDRARQFGRSSRARVLDAFDLNDAIGQYLHHFQTLAATSF